VFILLQIVCGISAMVMGTVAFIEERGEFNLGLGIPAGAATVLAAGKKNLSVTSALAHSMQSYVARTNSSVLQEIP
jgi:hypothetical protein